MKHLLPIVLLILAPVALLSQGERLNWVFGDSCGVTFNTPNNAPEIIPGTISYALEGCSVTSDSTGQLLFSTDGIFVRNAQFKMMNPYIELNGQFSSTQSCIIIKLADKPGFYYVFTVGGMMGDGSTRGLYYSIIDMSKNNGLGGVVEYNHNVNTFAVEKITAIPNASNSGIWIIVNNDSTGYYYSYLFEDGEIINVTTSQGVHLGNTTLGYLKPNRLGNMLASSEYREKAVVVYDFDRFTGKMTPKFDINFKNEIGYEDTYAYGLEFSNNGKFIYSTLHLVGINHSSIVQFDLSYKSGKEIWQNKYIVADGVSLNNSAYYFGALLMAPDSNIYVAKFAQHNLSKIDDPNIKGVGCNFILNSLPVDGTCRWGLPNYYDFPCKIMQLPLADTVRTCFRKAVSIGIDPEPGFVYKWQPTYGLSRPTSSHTKVIIDTDMVYTLYATDTVNGCMYFDSVVVMTSTTDGIQISGKNVICEGDSVLLSIPDGFSFIKWSNGEMGQSIYVKEGGVYQVTCNDSNLCVYTAEKEVRLNHITPIEISGDHILCENASTKLSIGNSYRNPVWSTGATTLSINVSKAGTYSVAADDADGCPQIGEFTVQSASPDLYANLDYDIGNICLNRKSSNQITLSQIAPFAITIDSVYSAQDSNNVLTLINYNQIVGKFGVDDTKDLIFNIIPYNAGNFADTIFCRISSPCSYLLKIPVVGYAGKSELKIIGNDYFCKNDSTFVYIDDSFTNIKWSNGNTANGIYISKSGNYIVECSDTNGCSYIGQVIAKEIVPDSVEIDGDNQICKEGTGTLTARGDFVSYLWSTGSQNTNINIKNAGIYTVEAVDSLGCTHYGSFEVQYYPERKVAISGQPLFCALDGQTLKAATGFTDYKWSNGETGQSVFIHEPGIYTVAAKDNNGCIQEGEFETDVYGFQSLDNQSIDLGDLCQSESVDFSVKIVNTLDYTVTIDTAGVIYGTEISYLPQSMVTEPLAQQSATEYKFHFKTGKPGEIDDTVYIHFSAPCDYYYRVPVKARVSPRLVTISVKDTLLYFAGEYCIPVYGKFDCDVHDSSVVDYTAGFDFSSKLFTPQRVAYGTILSVNDNGNGYNVQISGTGIILTKEPKIINYICGNINAGREDNTSVAPVEYTEGTDISTRFETGNINFYICSNDLRQIDLFTLTEIYATPNPVTDNIKVTIKSEETGDFRLELISTEGTVVNKYSFTREINDPVAIQVTLPTRNIANGLYFLRLMSPGNMVNTKVIIQK